MEILIQGSSTNDHYLSYSTRNHQSHFQLNATLEWQSVMNSSLSLQHVEKNNSRNICLREWYWFVSEHLPQVYKLFPLFNLLSLLLLYAMFSLPTGQ